MDQYTVPAIVPPATTGNLSDLVANRATNEPNRITLSRPLGEGWQGVSAKEFDSEVRAVAKGLMAANINVGDRVAIMAKTRYEWTVLDFAIWYAGAVSVPIYESIYSFTSNIFTLFQVRLVLGKKIVISNE